MKYTLQIIVIATLLALGSCKSDPASEAQQDTVLDIAVGKDPGILNPALSPTASARLVYRNIFVPMADFDPESYKLTPILIKEVPEPEDITEGPYKGGTKYTVELRDDARWDNGQPITAKDVAFTIKTIKHPGTNAAGYRSYFKWISDVETYSDNDKKVSLIFKDYYILAKELAVTFEIYPQYFYDPSGALTNVSIAELGSPDAADLVAKTPALDKFAKDFNSIKFSRESVSGAGPYELSEWVTDQYILLTKKKNYWADKSDNPVLANNPEQIKFHMMADATSAMTQLKEGNIDVFANMSAKNFFDLKENELYKDKFQFYTPELLKLYYIGINNSKAELSDPDIRRALAKLVDVPELIELIEGGLGRQSTGAINAVKEYHNKDLAPITLDIEGAKKIMQSEGWKDTNGDGSVDKTIKGRKVEMDLDFYITGSALSKNIALLMQKNAKEAGIKINIITKPYGDFKRENLKKRDYDITALVVTQDMVLDDPYSRWHSDNDDPKANNDISYRSPKADALIDKIRSTKSDTERNQYYKELQQVMYDDQPVIFLYNPTDKLIVSNKWKGSSTSKRPGYFAGTFTAN